MLGSGLNRLVCLSALAVAALTSACTAARPTNIGMRDGKLQPCPSTPNCVCSDEREPSHYVDPLTLAPGAENVWREVHDLVVAMPGTRIVEERGTYLHAECRSAVFRFVDDLELDLRVDAGIIAIRSASRLGYSDMGVNRRRVGRLRAALQARGTVTR
jgi:uncharacterized protein (DUF1499 family)